MIPWIKKYQPKKIADIIGQQSSIKKIIELIKLKQPILIYGNSGSGKTSTVHSIAKEYNYELIEINASDFRNKDQINSVLGNTLKQKSLFMQEKLLLIDEVDGISGTKDRGGMQEILKLLAKKKMSIILTANNIWDKKFYNIRNITTIISFSGLNYLSITNILENICIKENIKYEKEFLKTIARRSGGDARAGINDLQMLVANKNELKKEDLELLNERDKTEKIQNAFMKIFKTLDFNIAYHSFDDVEESYDKIIILMDENLSKEYTKEDLKKAYNILSKIDIFSKRIKRRQNWRYLVYIYFMLSVSIALAKKEKKKGFTQYNLSSSRIKKIYFGNKKNIEKKLLAEKISKLFHCSKYETFKTILPFLNNIIKNLNKEKLDLLKKELNINDEDLYKLK